MTFLPRFALIALVVGLAACGNSSGVTGAVSGAATAASSGSGVGVSVAASSSGPTGATVAASSGHSSTGASSGSTGASSGGVSSAGHSSSGSAPSSVTGSATGSATGSGASSGGGSTSGTSGVCGSNAEFVTGCSTDSDCACGLICVTDPAFGAGTNACEYPCTSTDNCPNAASVCSKTGAPVDGSSSDTCTLNSCGLRDVAGQACDAFGDGGASGTCIPQNDTSPVLGSAPDALLCIQNGTATGCTPGQNDDDPEYSSLNSDVLTSLYVATPFPRTAADLCGAGQACNDAYDAGAGPLCQTVCSTATQTCPGGGTKCVAQDSADTSWGFCGACVADGDSCLIDSDCCNSNSSCGVLGTCG